MYALCMHMHVHAYIHNTNTVRDINNLPLSYEFYGFWARADTDTCVVTLKLSTRIHAEESRHRFVRKFVRTKYVAAT